MRSSKLDNLPDSVQRAIYHVFLQAPPRDKVIFLSRLEYGNDLSYKEISEMIGVSFQYVQMLYDKMIDKVRTSPYVSGSLCSGIFL